MPKFSYWLRHHPIRQFIDRGRHGFAPADCWNLDQYLSEVLVNALQQLRTTTHGYPPDLKSGEEWDVVLAEMIEGFRLHLEMDNFEIGYLDGKFNADAYTQQCAWRQKKLERSLDLFKRYYSDLWD